MIIGIHGKAGSGKTTLAAYLEQEKEYTRISFAKALKNGCAAMFGFSEYQLYDKGKERKVAKWDKTPREILQAVGVALQAAVDPDIWVKCADDSNTRGNKVFEDVRYKNEVEYILAKGGYLIILKRGGHLSGGAANHISEQTVCKEDYPQYSDFIVELDNEKWNEEELLTRAGSLIASWAGVEHEGISPLMQGFRDQVEILMKGKASFGQSYEECFVNLPTPEDDSTFVTYFMRGRNTAVALYRVAHDGEELIVNRWDMQDMSMPMVASEVVRYINFIHNTMW